MRLPFIFQDISKLKKKGIFFKYENGRIEVHFEKSKRLKPFFLDEKKYLKLKKQISKKQPLISAITSRRFRPKLALDLTAGFGFDALCMAIYGISVICIEKNPIIFALLREYIGRIGILDMEVATRIRPILENSLGVLKKVGQDIPYPDVIYLDPFFPDHSKRRAREKKYMHVIRMLAQGEGDDLYELLENGFWATKSRVVLKRPLHAKAIFIGKIGPEYQVKGRGHRFDVYIKK
ncbi:hypothetical protein JCM13304A_02850 [Desulfothermus okinawensis JCM 13304]